jgi:ATP-dependent RNA helicase RhlE
MHTVKTFATLGLAEPILQALEGEGYTSPTPIQTKAIPFVLAGRDLLGIAQTGTGKTAAFALPILHRLAADRRRAQHKGCRALILSPTRELATQIGESFRTYGRRLDLRVAVIFGGVAHRPQIDAVRSGVDVLVATPGRLLDHVAERNLDLSGTEILVLDEADQMLDLGFVKPIRRVVSMLSRRRQNLFFSATMPKEIGELAGEMLNDPARVEVAPAATTVERIAQRVILVEQTKKRSLLVELLANAGMSRTLVFTRTKRGADRVAEHLDKAGLGSAAIHGNKSQPQRQRALESFRSGKVRVLVATDIAARGIDIDLVTHVVNYELPEVPEQYVHRIGRTGRAGADGEAISLCDNEERGLLRDIERVTRQQIPHEDRRNDASLVAVAARPARERSGARGGGERRGSAPHGDRTRRQGPHGDGGRGGERGARQGGRGGEPGAHRAEAGQRHNGDRPGESRHGQAHRTGDRPAGPRHGEARQVESRNGEARHNGDRPGASRNGEARHGRDRHGDQRHGAVRRGDARPGHRPGAGRSRDEVQRRDRREDTPVMAGGWVPTFDDEPRHAQRQSEPRVKKLPRH